MKLRELLKENYGADVAYQIRSAEQYASRLNAGVSSPKDVTITTSYQSLNAKFFALLSSGIDIRKAAKELGWIDSIKKDFKIIIGGKNVLFGNADNTTHLIKPETKTKILSMLEREIEKQGNELALEKDAYIRNKATFLKNR